MDIDDVKDVRDEEGVNARCDGGDVEAAAGTCRDEDGFHMKYDFCGLLPCPVSEESDRF